MSYSKFVKSLLRFLTLINTPVIALDFLDLKLTTILLFDH